MDGYRYMKFEYKCKKWMVDRTGRSGCRKIGKDGIELSRAREKNLD